MSRKPAFGRPWILLLAASPATLAQGVATTIVGSVAGNARFDAPGQVVAVRQAALSAQAGGRVVEVLVRSGEAVRRDQVLMRIDAPAASAAADASRAQAAAAAAQLASARADFERTQRLHEKQYVSDAALQRAEAQLRTLEAQATASTAQSRSAAVAAGWQSLQAPYDGRVTAVHVAAGDLAQPGQPLVSVYAPGPMRVLADVPEDVARRLAPDQPAQLNYPAGACTDAPATASGWTLVPGVDPRSRSVGVRIELPDPRGCLPGVLVRVSLPTREASQTLTLTVPHTAVIRRGELEAVYVMGAQGRVDLRQVRLGMASGDSIEVLAGLEKGERVVIDAAHYRPPATGRDPLP